jgi:Transposase DDE domain group 1
MPRSDRPCRACRSHRFRANEVRLLLSVIAYNLGNLLRRLVLPVAIQDWSLTSLQQRLLKTRGPTHSACSILHTAARRELLDRGPLSADSYAHRAARLAPDVIGREQPRVARRATAGVSVGNDGLREGLDGDGIGDSDASRTGGVTGAKTSQRRSASRGALASAWLRRCGWHQIANSGMKGESHGCHG